MRTRANGIEIEYEIDGPPDGEPLLLVNGFAVQLVRWPPGFVDALVAAGFRVIRFDNRDVGLSSKLDDLGRPPLEKVLTGEVPAPYGLADMADDAAGLLDAIGIDAAHVVGMSMGGMIAQLVAIRHPDRTRTMTTVMSTTGSRDLPLPHPAAMAVLAAPPEETREKRIDQSVDAGRVLWGDSPFPFEEAETRREAVVSEERCFHPDGVSRQFLAIATAADRTEALRDIAVPCLVIHGDIDPVFPVDHARATAAALPGSSLAIFEGMGHALPSPLFADQAEHLARLAGLT